jgi:GNAT superfamily N-acetyltransferase
VPAESSPGNGAETDVVLRDGSTVTVRPLMAADEGALSRFYRGLSGESRYLRFFSAPSNFDHIAHRLAEVEGGGRYGIVAVAGPNSAIVAHAAFFRSGPDRAEVALAVADRYQSRGLGAVLLRQIARAAGRAGVSVLEGIVQSNNRRMLELVHEIERPVAIRWHQGEATIEVRLSGEPG